MGIGDKYWITSLIPPSGKGFKTTFDYKNKFRANFVSTEPLELGKNSSIEDKMQVIVAAKRVEIIDGYADSLDIVWANGVTGNFQNHGSSNRGSTTVAFSLGINGMETQAISLFPVPANDVLSVSLQNVMLDNTTIDIYSALGALVLSQAIDHKSSVLDVSNLAKGIYVVKVTASSGVLTTRFIKE